MGADDAVRKTPFQILQDPFPEHLIGGKPRVTCQDCKRATSRVCNRHRMDKCPKCKQWITTGHIDLDYVGHADITRRLLEADPRWAWRPAAKDPDIALLTAAIATGNAEIVRMVYDNAPPMIDRHGGMWMELTVHDEDGTPVTRLGYGDAQGKNPGPDAIKEIIGDGLRNAGMRFGLALQLWSKQDWAEGEAPGEPAKEDKPARATTRTTTRRRNAAAAASADPTDAAAAAAPSTGEAGPSAAETPASPPLEPADTLVRDLADLAANLVQQGATVSELKTQTYDVAQHYRVFRALATCPWTGADRPLIDIITDARARIEQAHAGEGSQEGVSGGDQSGD